MDPDELMMLALDAGFTAFCLHTSRGTNPRFTDLFSSFGIFTKMFIIELLRKIAIVAGLILFVIPGLFAAYRFRMAILVMYDNPEIGALECLRRSSQMMRGHCMELFVLDLSFLGWWIACQIVSMLGIPLLDIWVRPYRTITNANYYNAMIGYQGEPIPEAKPEE